MDNYRCYITDNYFKIFNKKIMFKITFSFEIKSFDGVIFWGLRLDFIYLFSIHPKKIKCVI
jgi:hypothetical protein